jgi:hypothetical protein
MNLNEYVRQRGLSDNERMKYDFQIIEGVKKRSNIWDHTSYCFIGRTFALNISLPGSDNAPGNALNVQSYIFFTYVHKFELKLIKITYTTILKTMNSFIQQ